MGISYCVLASGSSGNCLWVRGGGTQVLVDCGLSARQICRRLAEAGGRIEDIEAVVCTHGHCDHVGGARVLARKHDVAILGTEGTLSGLVGIAATRLRELPLGGAIKLRELTIQTVPTSHDAPQPVALRLSDGATSLGVLTDLGVAPAYVARAFAGVDGLVLEMNHELPMLLSGPYPERLKRRIQGRWGHLSNDQGAQLLGELLHDGLQHVTLGHLSEHNNTVDLARAAAEAVLARRGGRGPKLAVMPQRTLGTPVSLSAQALAVPARARQLALPFR